MAPLKNYPRRLDSWLPRLLLGAFGLELANLFAIVATQGFVHLPPAFDNRFTSFAVHAAAAWLLLAAHHFLARRPRRTLYHDAAELVLVAVCLFGARLYFEHGVRLSADSVHYFVQARSLLFDGDVDFTNDYQGVRPRINISERYPVGLPLLSLPFLAGAHLLVRIGIGLGLDLPAHGFGYPYETAFELSGYFFASLALVWLLRTVSAFVPLGLAALSLVTSVAASFLGWYMVVEAGMPHAMSFAWTSFFLCYWLNARPVTRRRDFALLGLLIGVAALVRWQNGVMIVLPLLDRFCDSREAKTLLHDGVVLVASAAAAFLPQLVFWQVVSGSPVALPTEGHNVSWTQMRWSEVLFSTNRGLFPWNPVAYLGVLGLVLWLRSSRLAWLFMTGFALQVYVNASVGIWWAGWSFGGRRFDGCFLFFVVGLAVLFDWLRRHPIIPILGGSLALVLWNLELAHQTRRGLVPPDRLVSFRSVSERTVRELYDRFGYPFAAPANWIFARRFGVSPEKFDRVFGHEGFGNFRLVFDSGSEPFVATGWGDAELDADGRPFRWSLGEVSQLLVPLRAVREYELNVEVRPFSETVPNELRVSVNGSTEPGRRLSTAETLTARWVLSAELFRPGVNVLAFRLVKTKRPSELDLSADSRELGAAFYRMELVAVPD